jgi:4-amino-4-deoxy-L-arabinose transferase-like glycosyltransferase
VESIARSATLSCLLLLLVSLGTIFFRLGSLPLIGADEPRYARIAQEMRQDHRLITPTLEFKPWLEKPPLYYWITIPFYSILGTTETAARLGPAVLGLISALAVFWLGAKLWSRLAGLMGASILLTAMGYVGFARGASTDMPMTACLTVALALLAAAAAEKDFAGWKVLLAYPLLGMSVLAKGPVAVILAAGTLVLFWLFDERGGSMRRWHVVSGLIITSAVSLPWFWLAFRQNGFAFIATFLVNHNLARYATDIHHHEEPFYYYLPVVLGLFFPWSAWLLLLVPRSIADGIRNWRSWNPATLFLLCWIVFPLIFFSLSLSKLSGYILPILPPLALLLGVGSSQMVTGENLPRMQIPAAWLYLLSCTGVAVATPLILKRSYGGAWQVGLPITAAVLVPALFGFYFGKRGRGSAAFTATLIQGLITILAVAHFAFPVLGEYHSTREVALQALAHDEDGKPIVTLFSFHHALHYYTGYRIAEDFTDLGSLLRFSASHPRLLVVTGAEHVPQIEQLHAFTIKFLGAQGTLRLLELIH